MKDPAVKEIANQTGQRARNEMRTQLRRNKKQTRFDRKSKQRSYDQKDYTR